MRWPGDEMAVGEFKKRLSRWANEFETGNDMHRTFLWVLSNHVSKNDGSWVMTREQIADEMWKAQRALRMPNPWKPSPATIKRFIGYFAEMGVLETEQTWYRNRNGKMVRGGNRIWINPTIVVKAGNTIVDHDLYAEFDDDDPLMTRSRPAHDPRNDPRNDPLMTRITGRDTRTDSSEQVGKNRSVTDPAQSADSSAESSSYNFPKSNEEFERRYHFPVEHLVKEYGLEDTYIATMALVDPWLAEGSPGEYTDVVNEKAVRAVLRERAGNVVPIRRAQ